MPHLVSRHSRSESPSALDTTVNQAVSDAQTLGLSSVWVRKQLGIILECVGWEEAKRSFWSSDTLRVEAIEKLFTSIKGEVRAIVERGDRDEIATLRAQLAWDILSAVTKQKQELSEKRRKHG